MGDLFNGDISADSGCVDDLEIVPNYRYRSTCRSKWFDRLSWLTLTRPILLTDSLLGKNTRF